MELLNRADLMARIQSFASDDVPFLFMIDYCAEHGVALSLKDLPQTDIACNINGVELGRKVERAQGGSAFEFNICPIRFKEYLQSFQKVQRQIRQGNSYLLNLTFATNLGHALNLEDIYQKARAPYKLLFGDQFIFYSPEPFVRIEGDMIYSFPMKGTISTVEPNSLQTLMDSKKELYEHFTIVDLIRNDLAMVAKEVEVEQFRYPETLATDHGSIIQTSSRISGHLPSDWKNHLAEIIFRLLPAGSISGAPKEATTKAIEEAELSSRGFYTGVMGVFDGQKVDSCVIIRYIERQPDGSYSYRSGGGITSQSIAKQEYNEMIEKIYVPTI